MLRLDHLDALALIDFGNSSSRHKMKRKFMGNSKHTVCLVYCDFPQLNSITDII